MLETMITTVGGIVMMYAYMTLADETEVTHSHLIEKDDKKIVEVHFERPTEDGFDTARCRLPDYQWLKNSGYTDAEIVRFEQYLKNNEKLIFKYAASGGIDIA